MRNFYSGNHLLYDSSGIVSNASSGDWTTDGVVMLKHIAVSNHHLTLRAERLVVAGGGGFHLVGNGHPQSAGTLTIDAELSSDPDGSQLSTLISRIFLRTEDDLGDLVPDFWKACVQQGLAGSRSSCRFSPELRSIPGVASSNPQLSVLTAGNVLDPAEVRHNDNGITLPRTVHIEEPDFSTDARKFDLQGSVRVGLTVNEQGVPINIRVLNPLGCGLDAKAVRAVGNWRFESATKDGKPVPAEIAVEIDFHRY